MATDHLLVERRDAVLYLTMNRPEKLNALSEPMTEALVAELTAAAADPAVGAIVLTGAGRGFCAGGDIGAMRSRNDAADEPPPTIEDRASRLRRMEEASLLLHEIPKVTIAAVNGPAAGAGFGLALACDLRIASDQARFGTAFAKIGFSGDFGGTYTLTRLVGPAKARELYLLAEMITAEEALRLGIVNWMVPAPELSGRTESIARRIANGPRIAYAYMKANLNLALTSDLRTILERESLTQTLSGRTEDHREAVKAFLEKREPKFEGR
ncbi:MAG TPA: enoyl-CoA hydratase [Candidatus Binataceae bacterium]|nr:enoyl-CoA hydratase [Candidatus Binataceae bacterium]